MNGTRILLPLLSMLLLPALAGADEPQLKPFVLASRTRGGDVEGAVAAVKERLATAGFELAGAYAPYPGAQVLVVTSWQLRWAAARTKFGAYAAGQRVTVTKVGDEVQVAFTNPVYMQYAYRLDADLAPVAAQLAAALGRLEEFGPGVGKTPSELRKFHYMVGMEYFDEPTLLGRFGSHASAVKAVRAGLAAGKGGARPVYEIDVPENKETVFGVALTEGCSGDTFIMKEIDAKPLRSTGHLPYELLVSGPNVYALYARFRIAINFPDLKMMGSNSFMNIRCAPDAIAGALKSVVALK